MSLVSFRRMHCLVSIILSSFVNGARTSQYSQILKTRLSKRLVLAASATLSLGRGYFLSLAWMNSLSLDSQLTKTIYQSTMPVDWRQLKHAYLLAAMLYLSIALVTNSTGWNHLLVLLTLVGHAYLAFKMDTVDFVLRALGGVPNNAQASWYEQQQQSQQSQQNRPYSPTVQVFQPLDTWYEAKRYEDIMELNRSRQSLEDSLSAEKSRHEKLTSLKEMAENRKARLPDQPSEMRGNGGPANSSWDAKPELGNLFSNEANTTLKDLAMLKQHHERTLRNEKLDPRVHLNGVSQVVNLLCILVSDVYHRNEANILALNSLLMTNFHLRLIGSPSGNLQQFTDLDDVVATAVGLKNLNYLRWKWAPEITPQNKIQALSQFVKLSADRMDLDRYIFVEEERARGRRFREKAFLRLKTIADELNPSHYSSVNLQRQQQLREIPDSSLIFSFVCHSINKMIHPANLGQLRVRKVESAKYRPGEEVCFLAELLDSGIWHLNIGIGSKIYGTEPGQNNIYSCFFFYMYVLKVRFSQQLQASPELKHIVGRIVL